MTHLIDYHESSDEDVWDTNPSSPSSKLKLCEWEKLKSHEDTDVFLDQQIDSLAISSVIDDYPSAAYLETFEWEKPKELKSDKNDCKPKILETVECVSKLAVQSDKKMSEPKISKKEIPVSLHLPRWNINQDKTRTYSNYGLIGSRNTGKTILARYLYQETPAEELFVISESAEATQEYKDMTDYIYNSERDLDLILDHCKANPTTSRVIIIDDVIDLKKSKSFKFLIINGRHLRATIILSSQYDLNFSPDIYANLDTIFLFSERKITSLNRLYHKVGGMFQTLDMFKAVMKHICHDFTTLVINQSSRDANLCHWFRAPIFKANEIKKINTNIKPFNKILVDIETLRDLQSQVKQLKSTCSQLLDQFKKLHI